MMFKQVLDSLLITSMKVLPGMPNIHLDVPAGLALCPE